MADSNTGGVQGSSQSCGIDVTLPDTMQSLQIQFVMLQLKQSRACKNSANEYVEKLKASQAASKACSEMLDMAYKNRVNDPDEAGKKKGTVPPGELLKYCEDNNIGVPKLNDAGFWDYNAWDTAIKAITNYQEQLTSSSQTDMVFLQDFMGQYNSYMQGASKAGTDVSALLKSILTR